MVTILDGRKTSAEIKEELKRETESLAGKGIVPGITGILVGEDPGSASYVRLKEKAANQLGIRAAMLKLAENVSEADVLKEVDRLNQDKNVHGIFIQLPMPGHIDENRVLNAVAPDKDVDGFHPSNVGRAWLGQSAFLPATPIGIHEILVRYGYANLKGKSVVIVNVDNLVGKPLASLWAQEAVGANVTLCHPNAPDLANYTRGADIVVVAVDKARFITADMVKEGVIAIDFGANYIKDPSDDKEKLVGDLDFDAIKEKAEAITPVPGGIGPMTVTMLMHSTVRAAKLAGGLQ
ncbi:MAG: tetrahydrofolate dehydrogenase/cyclohydrolase catalytic domain-containing protein [Dehalococcoidales bacterium]